MMSNKSCILALVCYVPLLLGCGKHDVKEEDSYTGPPVIQVQLFDSKYYAIDERVISVSFSGEGQETAWAEYDAALQPRIRHGKWNAEVKEFSVDPGHFSGAFTVVTSRYTYTFSKVFDTAQNKKVEVSLDFAAPDIILIHDGTNDNTKKTPLGSYDYDLPIDELDETCFRSAYVKMIRLLQERYEGVQLILIIGDMLSSDYSGSITAIAAHYKLPYVSFVGAQLPKCKDYLP